MTKLIDPEPFLNKIRYIQIRGKLYENHLKRFAEFLPEEIVFQDGTIDENFALIEKRFLVLKALKDHAAHQLYSKQEYGLLIPYLLRLEHLCDAYINENKLQAYAENIDEMVAQYFDADKMIYTITLYGTTLTASIGNDVIIPFKKYLNNLIGIVSQTNKLIIARKLIQEFTKITPNAVLKRRAKSQNSFTLQREELKKTLPIIYTHLCEKGWIDESCTLQNFEDAFSDLLLKEKIIWNRDIIELKIFLTFLFEDFIKQKQGFWATAAKVFTIAGTPDLAFSLSNNRSFSESRRVKKLKKVIYAIIEED